MPTTVCDDPRSAERLGYGPCKHCECDHWRSDGGSPERCGTHRGDTGVPCGHRFNAHY